MFRSIIHRIFGIESGNKQNKGDVYLKRISSVVNQTVVRSSSNSNIQPKIVSK